ncbi:MAG: DoxX family protein [Saprospiraceae bacterium]|nr:DoxX family protein [Saprospiraceae bacterium]
MNIKKIITIIVTALAVLMPIFSGIMKLTGNAGAVDILTKMGVKDHITLLGCFEIAFALLFLYPKTMKGGFVLLSCYFAGAIATEMSHASPLNALTPIVLVWIAAYLRDKSVFLPTSNSFVVA